MEKFIDYILQFGNLNKQQIDLIKNKAKETKLNKDEYFSEAGKIPRQIGFILEGVLRVCYYNNKGEEITMYFFDENNIVSDYFSLMENLETYEYVQAVTDSKLLVFSKQDWYEISNSIIGWDKIVAKIVQKCLMEKVEKRSPLVSEDATARYISFIQKFPNLINRIPLSYVASYLGITQQSLSRIRKNIT